MKGHRPFGASVIALTLAVTAPALAAADAPATPATPAVATPATPAAPSAPTAPAAPAAAPVFGPASPQPSTPPASAARSPGGPVVAAPTSPRVPAPTTAPATSGAVASASAIESTPAMESPAKSASSEAGGDLANALRPAPKELVLASEPTSTPWTYKLIFMGALGAAGALLWRRRRSAISSPRGAVRVLGKTPVGLRGELTLVEVSGMKLLVGITPSSMQTLAVLPEETAEEAFEAAPARHAPAPSATPSQGSDLAARARALFSSIDLGPPVPPRLHPDASRASEASASRKAAPRPAAHAAARYASERDVRDLRDEDDAPESAPAPPRGKATRSGAASRSGAATRSGAASRASSHGNRRLVSRDGVADDESRGRARPARDQRDFPLEGQARGLALMMGGRK